MSQVTAFKSLNEIQRELGRVFDRNDNTGQPTNGFWSPQVDIKESETDFTVIADIPGIDPEKIEVTLHNGLLTIRGERAEEINSVQGDYKRRERVRGTFQRQFTLPETTREDAIEAKAVNGVLEVNIPKAEKPVPLSITVKKG